MEGLTWDSCFLPPPACWTQCIANELQSQREIQSRCFLGWLFSHSITSNSLWPLRLQHIRPSCPSPSPGAWSNSYPLCQWHHPTISSSVIHFAYCLQSFPASGSFLMSQLFTSGGQNIGASASASVPPINIQDWISLGWVPEMEKGSK